MTSSLNSYAIACGEGGWKLIPGLVESNAVLLRIAIAATIIPIIQKELSCPLAMTRSWAPQSRHAVHSDFASIAH